MLKDYIPLARKLHFQLNLRGEVSINSEIYHGANILGPTPLGNIFHPGFYKALWMNSNNVATKCFQRMTTKFR